MTAAKSKPKRAEESTSRNEPKREKATSSKVIPAKQEIQAKEQARSET